MSAKKLDVALATGAEGVPTNIKVAFSVTGALFAALIVNVTVCPAENTLGENVAEVPGGSPVTDGITSKSKLVGLSMLWNCMLAEPPIGTPSSLNDVPANERIGMVPLLTVKLKSP